MNGDPAPKEAAELAVELVKFEPAPKFSGGFVKVPIDLWDGGFFARMRPAEKDLLMGILRLTNFRRDHRIVIGAGELWSFTSISRRAFWSAIRKLSEAEIIEDRRVAKKHEILIRPSETWNLQAWPEPRAKIRSRTERATCLAVTQ